MATSKNRTSFEKPLLPASKKAHTATLSDDEEDHRDSPAYDPLWLMVAMMAIFFTLMALVIAAG